MVAVLPPHHHVDAVGVHRLRVSEYLVLAELDSWPRTELLQGVIYDMPSESRLHSLGCRAVFRALERAFPDHEVLFGGSVESGEYSMPEPDVFVERPAPGPAPKYFHSRQLDLVLEVSVTTLAHDRGPKLAVYAEAGIPEYWIVVPQGSTGYLLRHTEPEGQSYRRVVRVELPDGLDGLDVEAVRAGP